MGIGSLGSVVGEVRGPALVLFLFYMNLSGMCPVFLLVPAFDDTGSLVILDIGWSIPVVFTLVTASYFLAGNREAELKYITFFLPLLFHVFLSFLFFYPLAI